MKKRSFIIYAALLFIAIVVINQRIDGQSSKALTKKYFLSLPACRTENNLPRSYKMTAVYINRDLYGNFMNKTRISGVYTNGLENGYANWKNVYIASSNSFSEQFPLGEKQEYIENMKYFPSEKMLEKGAFKNFPSTPAGVFARNLIWDMLTFDIYGSRFNDSLNLNQPYEVFQNNGEFSMDEIGKYKNGRIVIIWKGISEVNGKMCAIIDFNAIDNRLELDMEQLKSKGTEQYWGTCWISLKTGSLEKGYMYSGTMLETEITGFNNKFLIKTVRELWVEPYDL